MFKMVQTREKVKSLDDLDTNEDLGKEIIVIFI